MAHFNIKKIKLFLILLGIALLLTSCYTEHVCLDYKVYPGAEWTTEKTQIVFAASKKVYHQPKGVTKFPDGGQPDYLKQELTIYTFDTVKKKISPLINLNDLVPLFGNSPSKLKIKFACTDSLLYCQVQPITEWKYYLKWARTARDSLIIQELKQKYAAPILVNHQSGKPVNLEAKREIFNDIPMQPANLTRLNALLKEVPLSDWGLLIKEYDLRSDEMLIDEVIFLLNPCFTSRRAIIEQIISKLNKEEIKNLLLKMEKHQQQLEGIEKKEYELYSKETYEKIKELL